MSLTLKRTLTVAAVALVAFAGAFLMDSDLHAQGEEGSGLVVGTYQPQQIAQATNLQQKMMQEMQGLQQRAQQAQQSGDQAEMQKIQQEAQQIQQDAADQFRTDLEGVMPQVAEQTGVQVIATEVTYTADGVTTKDITQAIIDAMGGGESMGEDSMGGESMGEGAMSEGEGSE